MKQLKFHPSLVESILSGEKCVTWRLFDDKDLSVGDELSFVNSETLEEFARARIIDVTEKILGEVTEEDFAGHEKYASKEEMFETFRRYYGDKVGSNTSLKIVRFELIS